MMMKSKNARLLLGISGFIVLLGIVAMVILSNRTMTDNDYINDLVPVSKLPADVWEREQEDTGNRIKVTLRSQEPIGLVYLDFLRFVSNESDTKLTTSEKVDDAWVINALSSYDSSRRLRTCTIGDIRLYEYDAVIEKRAYNLRYWVIPITPTRTATLIVAVTVDNRPYFDELSKSLRPNEAACPEA